MNNFTLLMKQNLETLVEGGAQVATVTYDPTATLIPPLLDPEAEAIADGWVQYYREATATLVEVIYTK